jgi:hypothetical protein
MVTPPFLCTLPLRLGCGKGEQVPENGTDICFRSRPANQPGSTLPISGRPIRSTMRLDFQRFQETSELRGRQLARRQQAV